MLWEKHLVVGTAVELGVHLVHDLPKASLMVHWKVSCWDSVLVSVLLGQRWATLMGEELGVHLAHDLPKACLMVH